MILVFAGLTFTSVILDSLLLSAGFATGFVSVIASGPPLAYRLWLRSFDKGIADRMSLRGPLYIIAASDTDFKAQALNRRVDPGWEQRWGSLFRLVWWLPQENQSS